MAASKPIVTLFSIDVHEAKKHIGESLIVNDKVYGYKELSNMTLVNIGAAYPNQLMTVVLKGDARELATEINDKLIGVAGKIIDYKGKPEIEVTDLTAIKVF